MQDDVKKIMKANQKKIIIKVFFQIELQRKNMKKNKVWKKKR